jgi:hypothetical protein
MQLSTPIARHADLPAHAARRRLALGLALTCCLASQVGCSVWQQARRTLIHEPLEFSWKYDRGRGLKAYRQWADEAWAIERGACPEVAGDDDYALGFRDGFVDYVYAGGDGQPPPVPPRKFWNVAWRNPPGNAAAAQWFAGYQHGADVAREGGYRENGIVPSAYRWGGVLAAGGGELQPAPLGEDIGPPQEPLPEPGAPEVLEGFDDEMLPEEPLPESQLPDAPLPDMTLPDPEFPESVPAALADAEPDAENGPSPELAPAEIDEAAPIPRTSKAVERFRRAVSTVQFVEPSRQK